MMAGGLGARAANAPAAPSGATVEMTDSIVTVSTIAPTIAGGANNGTPFVSRTVLTTAEANATMEIEVSLKMRNFADLQARIGRGETIPAGVVAQNYEPTAADYQTVVNWLSGAGLTITTQDSHHLAIFAKGTVGQMATIFKVNFAKVAVSGVEYGTSAVTAPRRVPAAVAPVLVGINGLQTHVLARHHAEESPAISTSGPYLPKQVAQAYNAAGLPETGAGQTIAIVIDAIPATSDLTAFWTLSGVSQSLANITFVPVAGNPLPPVDTEDEASLDVEWSSSLAPAAKVRGVCH